MSAIASNSPRHSPLVSYEGQLSSTGLYHGEGILTVGKNTYEGLYKNGKCVPGTWIISTPTYRYSGDARASSTSSYPQYNGHGTLKNIQTGEAYIGQFRMNAKHGRGTTISTKGVVEGRWNNDTFVDEDDISDNNKDTTTNKGETKEALHDDAPRNGQGVTTTKNGSAYTGEFQEYLRHGQGVYIDAVTNVSYNGAWMNDVRHGTGQLFNGEGSLLYDGEWRHDKQTLGKCFDPIEKWTYDGELLANKFHGQGKFQDRHGSSYVGEWKEGQKHGLGCQKDKSSNVYIGEFVNDVRQGEGEELISDGSSSSSSSSCSYKGQWWKNKKHGMGTEVTVDGDTREGTWLNGNPVFGSGIEWSVLYANNEKYVGEMMVGFQAHCVSGTFKYDSGDVYKGGWRDGVRHGRGVMYHASGDVENDEWVDGVTKSLMKLLS